MAIKLMLDILLSCTLINYGVLLIWFLVFKFAHGWLYRLHSRWFAISPGDFDAIHYAGMALYKLGIILLNLTPYLALRMLG